MEYSNYILLGVGVALSILGFFLKKEAQKQSELDQRVKNLEIRAEKNQALDTERWVQVNKLLEDRRADIIKIYDNMHKK
jgi:flagellar motility protein MotE (MotC chaperone)